MIEPSDIAARGVRVAGHLQERETTDGQVYLDGNLDGREVLIVRQPSPSGETATEWLVILWAATDSAVITEDADNDPRVN